MLIRQIIAISIIMWLFPILAQEQPSYRSKTSTLKKPTNKKVLKRSKSKKAKKKVKVKSAPKLPITGPGVETSAFDSGPTEKPSNDPVKVNAIPMPATPREAFDQLIEDMNEDSYIDDIIDESLEEQFIENNIAISAFFDEVADGIDTYLIGKRVTTRKNETSVKVVNSTYIVERKNTQNNTSIGINLRLPNVEEYWQLKFTSYDESEERRGVQKGYLRNTPREQNYGATIGLFRKLGNIQTSFQPRVDLGDPLKISHSLTFESVADINNYSISPKLELFAGPVDGAGTYIAMNLNYRINKIYTFTFVNNAEYRDKKHLLSTANGFSVGQILNRFSSMSYSLIFNGINQPNHHLESYILTAAWSQLIYRRILDFQVIPHLDFNRELGFAGVPGLVFNLNLNF